MSSQLGICVNLKEGWVVISSYVWTTAQSSSEITVILGKSIN
ncbi:MAG TPA: hypothetical protein QF762_00045 [Acidimicrobiales bacterium]|nr:hypothetical protein [Acidimicrobiales bacterium]